MNKIEILKCGDIVLPGPETMSINNELLWNSATGRTISGRMAGDIISEFKTLNITWGRLTEEQYLLIRNNLVAGFFPVMFHDDGLDLEITFYRGTLTCDPIGYLDDGVYYYRSASVDIIQQ